MNRLLRGGGCLWTYAAPAASKSPSLTFASNDKIMTKITVNDRTTTRRQVALSSNDDAIIGTSRTADGINATSTRDTLDISFWEYICKLASRVTWSRKSYSMPQTWVLSNYTETKSVKWRKIRKFTWLDRYITLPKIAESQIMASSTGPSILSNTLSESEGPIDKRSPPLER